MQNSFIANRTSLANLSPEKRAEKTDAALLGSALERILNPRLQE